ncbi:hypothetical protein D7X33_13780 [Butyricicoccus sp. 1XD8-22]|nr:hypothetical protein D7X33_13780 [Butyricicoccus sp. 1XD8-22]
MIGKKRMYKPGIWCIGRSLRPARRRGKGFQPVGHYLISRAVRGFHECRDEPPPSNAPVRARGGEFERRRAIFERAVNHMPVACGLANGRAPLALSAQDCSPRRRVSRGGHPPRRAGSGV